MSVVAKFFIQSVSQSPDGSVIYNLGAVCRGEINMDWAAATPSGTLKHGPDDVLAAAWAARLDGSGPGEVEVLLQTLDPDGGWAFDKCEFSYGGCSVKFRQPGQPWGTLEMTINAKPATKVLREAFATSLTEGKPATFAVTFRAPSA